MHKLIVLLIVLAALMAVCLAMPSPEVKIVPSMLVHEEHLPNQGGQASDKTLEKFVEELLALRGKAL